MSTSIVKQLEEYNSRVESIKENLPKNYSELEDFYSEINSLKEFMNDKDMSFLFVYGTLMRGFHNHHLLRNSEFVGKAITYLPAYELDSHGAFPALHEVGNGYYVKGEVYVVNDEILSRTDRLEGHPNWYQRGLISCKVDNRIYIVWAYVMDGPVFNPLPVVNNTQEWR